MEPSKIFLKQLSAEANQPRTFHPPIWDKVEPDKIDTLWESNFHSQPALFSGGLFHHPDGIVHLCHMSGQTGKNF